MILRSLLSSLAAQIAGNVDQFEEKVELGFSRNKSTFRKNLEKRGIDVDKKLEESDFDSIEEVSAAQKVNDEIRFFSKDELTLEEDNGY